MALNWEEVRPNVDHPDGTQLIYEKALEWSKKLPEDRIFMEIGCWKGGTSMAIMQAIKDSGKDRWMFSVDPYGTLPFKLGTKIQKEAIYDEAIYIDAMVNMYGYAKKLGVNYYHWRLLSDDFMMVLPNIQFWYKGEQIEPKFGFVYIDGAHNGQQVTREVNWIKERMDKGMIVMDDVPYIIQDSTPTLNDIINKSYQDNFRAYYEVG